MLKLTFMSIHCAFAFAFYGAVGAVQTGPGAVANVVQNLGAEEKHAILQALAQVRAAVIATQELAAQRQELIEIADECSATVQSENPNNSKLRAMFDVLSSSIQTMASAQPAYQALKVGCFPWELRSRRS